MTNISEVILFVSSTSQNCIECVRMMTSHNLPVKFVRLDTREDRERARSGMYFQIVNVPSLVVFYTTNEIQMFVGKEKITSWVSNLVKGSSQAQGSQDTQMVRTLSEGDVYDTKSKSLQNTTRLHRDKDDGDSSDSSDDTTLRKKKRNHHQKYQKHQSRKSNKSKRSREKPRIEQSESDEDIEFFDEYAPSGSKMGISDNGNGRRDIESQTSGLVVGKNIDPKKVQSMNITAIAKKMQEDRDATLGHSPM